MAAAGLDSFEMTLSEQLLTLPTPAQLEQIKADTGYGTTNFQG
jgi:hypothetical protein